MIEPFVRGLAPSGQKRQSLTRGRGGAPSRASKGRPHSQGPLSGRLGQMASRFLSSRNGSGRSKKGPAALALAAGAAGLAVFKRRRSNAANEPIGQATPGVETQTVRQAVPTT